MKFEWIIDFRGYKFLMPKLDSNTIEKFQLGTWDLADFTFGAPTLLFSFFPDYIAAIPTPLKVLYRVENILRLLQWTALLKKHRLIARFISVFRNVIFRIADEQSWRVIK